MADGPKGVFDVKVVHAYLNKSGKEYTDDTVKYWYDPKTIDAATARNYKDEPGNDALKTYGECICMDVGLWAGNKTPGDAANHDRHREFGIITRNVAILCQFPGRASGKHPRLESEQEYKLNKAGGLEVFKQHIQPLLEHLGSGQNQHSGDLGDVEIIDATALTDEALSGERRAADDPNVYVFVGDLHLPIMNNRALALADRAIDGEVRRYGRLTLDDEMMADVTLIANAATQIKTVPEVAVPIILVTALKIWSREQLDHGFPEPDWEGWMSEDEAVRWANFYMGDKGKKGADIFQEAAIDLATFLNLLPKYRQAPLRLVQVGDFYDFWIGLKCGFKSNVEFLHGDVTRFVDHWKLGVNRAEHGVSRALGTLWNLPDRRAKGEQPVPVTVLAGNHDNYMIRCGSQTHFQPKDRVLFVEHGHKYDSFNSDTDARSGWAITQAAFICPQVRTLEDLATGLLTRIKRVALTNPGERLERMARAADVCFSEGRTIYVMGHTHRALLRKISIHPRLHSSDVCEYELKYLIKAAGEWLEIAKNYCKELAKRQLDRAKELATRCNRYLTGKIKAARRLLLKMREDIDRLKADLTEVEKKLLAEAKDELNKAKDQLDRAEKASLELAKKGANEAYSTMQRVETKLENLASSAQTAMKAVALQAKAELQAAGAWLSTMVQDAEALAGRAVDRFYALLNQALEEMKALMRKLKEELSAAIAKAGDLLSSGSQAVIDEAKGVWQKIHDFKWDAPTEYAIDDMNWE